MMELSNVPQWYTLGTERAKGSVWLKIGFEPWGMEWLHEERLVKTTPFVAVADQVQENFTHLIPSGTFLPFGFGGVGLVHMRQGGGVLKFPLTDSSKSELVSATLSALGVFLSVEPEFSEYAWNKQAYFQVSQKLIFSCTYHDRPQGRDIVGCLSPYALKRLKRIQQSRICGRDVALRRATKTARRIWYGPDHRGFVAGEDNVPERDFFADNPFELKDNWFLFHCPGSASGLVTKREYSDEDGQMFSGNNLDYAGQQLTVLGALAEVCQML
jgi:hypothetical protein